MSSGRNGGSSLTPAIITIAPPPSSASSQSIPYTSHVLQHPSGECPPTQSFPLGEGDYLKSEKYGGSEWGSLFVIYGRPSLNQPHRSILRRWDETQILVSLHTLCLPLKNQSHLESRFFETKTKSGEEEEERDSSHFYMLMIYSTPAASREIMCHHVIRFQRELYLLISCNEKGRRMWRDLKYGPIVYENGLACHYLRDERIFLSNFLVYICLWKVVIFCEKWSFFVKFIYWYSSDREDLE